MDRTSVYPGNSNYEDVALDLAKEALTGGNFPVTRKPPKSTMTMARNDVRNPVCRRRAGQVAVPSNTSSTHRINKRTGAGAPHRQIAARATTAIELPPGSAEIRQSIRPPKRRITVSNRDGRKIIKIFLGKPKATGEGKMEMVADLIKTLTLEEVTVSDQVMMTSEFDKMDVDGA